MASCPESGDPASLLRLILSEDEDLLFSPTQPCWLQAMRNSMDDVVGGHLTHLKTLVPIQHQQEMFGGGGGGGQMNILGNRGFA